MCESIAGGTARLADDLKRLSLMVPVAALDAVQAPARPLGQRKTRRGEPAGRPSIAGSYLDLVPALDPVV